MAYELKPNDDGITVEIHAEDREQLFRDVLSATLETAYGGQPAAGTYEGQVVPVQAVGADETALVSSLVSDSLRAIRDSNGTLRPPRWLSFDAARVTANLGVTQPRSGAREMTLRGVRLSTKDREVSAFVQLEAAGHH